MLYSFAMSPFFRTKRFIIWAALLLGVLLIAGIIIFWPYQRTAKNQITRLLESYGITVTSLTLERFEGNDALITDVTLGTEPKLTVQKLAAHYSLTEILRGKLRSLEVTKLDATLYTKNDRWLVGGLEPLFPHSAQTTDTSLPLSIISLLPESVSVKDSTLTLKHPRAVAQLPFSLDMTTDSTTSATLISPGIRVEAKPYTIQSGTLKAKANLTPTNWHITLTSPDITITGLDTPIPPLALHAELSLTPRTLETTVQLNDSTQAYRVDATLSNTDIAIKTAHIPWGGGQIAVQPVTLPIAMDKPIPLAIDIKEVDLESLLGAVSDGKIQGSGKVSGTLPIIYHPDGHITLQEGGAQALSDGTISVPPSFLPGDNEQLTIARTTLENFHYTTLQIRVLSQGDAATIQLVLEGNNPDAMQGRPVKLTVNLSGDILPLIQQSVLPINDLKQLMTIKDTP